MTNLYLWNPAPEDEDSLREVPYQAREIPWERLQQVGVMGEALQICGKGERLDRSASYRGTTGLFNVLGSGGVRDRSTQVYRKVPGEEAPLFETLLEVLKPKRQQYRSPRATRSEFKSVRQNKNKSLKEYFRRVRYLGDLVLCEKTLEEKDKDLRDQFLEGLFDSRLQKKLYEDETNRNFCSAHKNWNRSRKTPEMWTRDETRRHEQTEYGYLLTTGSRTMWSEPAFRTLTVRWRRNLQQCRRRWAQWRIDKTSWTRQ